MDIDLAIHSYLQYEQIEKGDRETLMEAMMINNDLENMLAEKITDFQSLVHRAEHLSIERELKVDLRPWVESRITV